ncbi:MAG: hypothetical protein IT290_11235, partial [Deltaproteobacteria bacterium]|nr:hypothetical protein [Deltaproteobacteria bacterium]
VRDAFGNFLRGDRYPVGILRLSLPPEDLDVNVHPQKTEVRFRSPEYIFRVVHRALRTAFDGAGLVSPALSPMAPLQSPRRDATQAEIAWFPPASAATRPTESDDIPDFRSKAPDSLVSNVTRSAPQTPTDAPRQAPNYSNLRYVGQVFQCYLLLEGSDTLFLVDMHAAHERVTHARLRQQSATAGISRQMLLLPEILRLDPSEAELYRGNADLISQLGFDVEELAPGEIVVRAVPALLAHSSPVKMLTDLLVGFEGDPVVEIEKRIDYAIARLACHASVRSGKSMNREEVGALMDALAEAECGGFCPHGRPVMCSVSEQEFESMFGRSE